MNQRINPNFPILLVDDEVHFLDSLEFLLSSKGFNNIICCPDSREVIPILEKQDISIIILDVMMPYISGGALLPQITANFPGIPVIIVTGINAIETAVECMKAGAFDYLVKPIESTRLLTIIQHALKQKEIEKENILLKKSFFSLHLKDPEAFSAMVTRSDKMQPIFKYLEVIADSPMPLLITGETGTGKELISQIVHKISSRSGPFVAVNSGGLDDTLFSDTLFGHKRGGFTGADRDRKGLVEKARGGFLFLDEIGDLSLQSQVKLLRLIQEGQYYPIGSDVALQADARLVVATNHDLMELMREKTFRSDLFYRLQTHHIHLPPLRERKEDIYPLVDYFLKKASATLGKNCPTPPEQLYSLLSTYPFPGNIRELESMVFDAVSRHQGGVLSMSTFREKINVPEQPLESPANMTSAGVPITPGAKVMFGDQLPSADELEKLFLLEAVDRADGNLSLAAQLAGLKRKTFSYRLKKVKES
jgi:DNA-binding NtrC family response regulator